MKPVVLCFCLMLCIYLPRMEGLPGAQGLIDLKEEPPGCSLKEEEHTDTKELQDITYTPMEALDIVKEKYAANFIRQTRGQEEDYYYKLPDAEYYLVYEGQGATEDEYIIHLYEFVTEDQVENIGHTVTYGWYRFNRNTGEVTED